jgi:hypothetical protein
MGTGIGRIRHLAPVLLIALMASSALSIAPTAAPVLQELPGLAVPSASAAGPGIDIGAATRYVVVPGKSVIRVTVDITAVNQRPNETSAGVVTRFYYNGVNLGIQPDAIHIAASQGGTAVRVTSTAHRRYKVATIHFRSNLYYGQTAKVRLTFDLPAGAPRSSSDVRVGPAFASFLAWAFGDHGTVRIEIPAGFDVTVTGAEPSTRTRKDGTKVLTDEPGSPGDWYAWIDARNDAGLTSEQLYLADGERITVRGWPEDSRWRKEVSSVLSDGVPRLVQLIGLPWPVHGALNVLEVYTPLLEGYAGFYDPARDEITISEDLDDVTIVHEASHAWFNDQLFTQRWITEGLADEYAARVLAATGAKPSAPDKVKPTDKAAFPLSTWGAPAPISDTESDAREQYGYAAAWTVVRQILAAAGEAGMRRVFLAAHDRTTAYVGGPAPEHTRLPNDWRRFLDLTEELGGATGVSDLMATWVLQPDQQGQLAARATARDEYHALVADGGPWSAPLVVRMSLDAWSFDTAESAIAEARTILDRRDTTASLAESMGLTPPSGLEGDYEAAFSVAALSDAAQLAATTESSLQAVSEAEDAAAAPRDWLVSLGLIGKEPDAWLAGARTDWEQGRLAAAADAAGLVVGTLAVAGDAGRGRAVLIACAIALVLLLISLLALLYRHRRRRRARMVAAAAPLPGAPVMGASMVAAPEPDAPPRPGATVMPPSAMAMPPGPPPPPGATGQPPADAPPAASAEDGRGEVGE